MAKDSLRLGKMLLVTVLLVSFVAAGGYGLEEEQEEEHDRFEPCCAEKHLVLDEAGTKCVCNQKDFYFPTKDGKDC